MNDIDFFARMGHRHMCGMYCAYLSPGSNEWPGATLLLFVPFVSSQTTDPRPGSISNLLSVLLRTVPQCICLNVQLSFNYHSVPIVCSINLTLFAARLMMLEPLLLGSSAFIEC